MNKRDVEKYLAKVKREWNGFDYELRESEIFVWHMNYNERKALIQFVKRFYDLLEKNAK